MLLQKKASACILFTQNIKHWQNNSLCKIMKRGADRVGLGDWLKTFRFQKLKSKTFEEN